MFSRESEASERPVESGHECVKMGQVLIATFWDFFGIVGRQHGVGGAVGLPDAARGAQLGVAATEPTCAKQITVGGEVAVFADSAAVWLQGNASSSWHAASVLPATARSKQSDRVNPGYRSALSPRALDTSKRT